MQHHLPPGFRFSPKDEELIVDYLKKKVLGQQLPSNAVIEAEIYGCEAQIQEEVIRSAGEKFFFVKKRMRNQEGTRMNRSANGASWKVTGNKKDITYKSHKLGIKRSLVFKGKSNHGREKRLLMDEYELDESIISKQEVEWVLCRIKEGKRSLESSEQSLVNTASEPSHLPCEPPSDQAWDSNNDTSNWKAQIDLEENFDWEKGNRGLRETGINSIGEPNCQPDILQAHSLPSSPEPNPTVLPNLPSNRRIPADDQSQINDSDRIFEPRTIQPLLDYSIDIDKIWEEIDGSSVKQSLAASGPSHLPYEPTSDQPWDSNNTTSNWKTQIDLDDNFDWEKGIPGLGETGINSISQHWNMGPPNDPKINSSLFIEHGLNPDIDNLFNYEGYDWANQYNSLFSCTPIQGLF